MELAGLYRDVVETSPDGIWVFGLDGRTLYANPALRRLLGAEESEMPGLTAFDCRDERDREELAAHLAELSRGGGTAEDIERRLVRRDGSRLWVTVRESELRAADGSRCGVVHRIIDDTERRRTVDDLTTSRRRLADAQRIARIGSWEWDLARDEIFASDELCALYGLDPAAFPASYEAFLGIVHEEDRATVDDAVQQALRDGGEFVFVVRVRAEKDWVWSRGRGVTQTDDSGRVVSMYGTHQDVTETRQAELALEDQMRQNALMQAVAVAANEARRLTDVLGQAQHLVLLHDDWERGRAFVPDDARSGVVPLYIRDEDRRADQDTPEASAMELELANRAFELGASVWDHERLTIASPVSYADEVCAVVTITSAPPLYRFEMIQSMVEQVAVQLGRVAEREHAERELAGARDGAMEASRQKSEFLATMSHEIRTPLNGVIGLNDLLLRTALSPDQLRLASGVQVASRALLSVINDILDFSKIEAGKLELERLDFEVRPVFDQVASVLAETARAKGLELMVSCRPDVPEVLSGDPTRLAQVLTNLGSNALKFTDEGEVYIRATVEPGADGRTRLRVSVADTGVGVPEGEVDTLFEAFTQADASTTRKYGGTGLGLAISREIVEALGGEIGLRPNPGGGSVFWFTAEFAPPAGPRVDPDDEYARSWLAGRRVLVVDDNDHNRLILEEQLAGWRMRSVAVVGADEAEAEMARALDDGDPFEGVLLDMAMPGRDGLDLARTLRRDPAYAGVRLVMLSSSTTCDADQARTHGLDESLVKPVLAGVLRNALLRQLAGVEPRPASEAPPAPEWGPARHVLVVEDNPVNQLVAVGMLEAIGYTAHTAEDGDAALAAVREHDYAAVLMDVQMPRMDGYAATRAIRAAERDRGPDAERLPVIAMTAAAVEGERERCLAAGMDDFLTKPVDPAALAAVLDLWIGSSPEPVRRTVPAMTKARRTEDPLDELAVDRLDELRDLDPGNTTYLDRAIGNFVANSPGAFASICEAAAAGDAETLKQVSHKLAGGALNLGVTAAGRTAQSIELQADTGSTEGALDLLPRLERDLERGRAALLAYRASYRTDA